MKCQNRKAQSTLEYAIIVSVVVGALLAMQVYMKRGIQGKMRESTDQIGEQFDIKKTTFNMHRERNGTTLQLVGGGDTRSFSDGFGTSTKQTHSEYGNETVGTQ
jgi:hypothetical protein